MQVINSIPLVLDTEPFDTWKQQWANQEGLDIHSYINDQCHPEQILMFSPLLFPTFIVSEGGVFLERNFSQEAYARSVNLAAGDMAEVERLMNYVKIYDVFGQFGNGVSPRIFHQLCEMIGFAWRMVLKEKFPDTLFTVEVSNSDEDYGPVVTFYQVKQ
ncbi:hypothetical protein [Pseudomonas atacamensis]|uniref:hypothetical protein n=1 Tax=Pseudomonas atacamensis TaxID=2565368 RepID=UPI0038123F10